MKLLEDELELASRRNRLLLKDGLAWMLQKTVLRYCGRVSEEFPRGRNELWTTEEMLRGGKSCIPYAVPLIGISYLSSFWQTNERTGRSILTVAGLQKSTWRGL